MTTRVLTRARTLAIVVVGLALAAPAGIAAAALSGIGHRWVDILAQFTGPALFAVALALIAAAVLRSRMLGGVAAAVCALVLAAGAGQWAPTRGWADPSSETLTLYSANLHVSNTDVEAIAASIAASDADVVVLIEVGAAPLAAIDTVLAGYPHRLVSGDLDRVGGTAVAVIGSRRPVRDLDLHVPVLHIVGAVVDTPLGPVTFAGAHFTRPWPYQIQWEQIRQAEGLTDWTSTVEGPLIVAGDFNSVSDARIGRIVRSEGLIAAPGWPGTWPTRLPSVAGITIDQVYRSPDLALVERRLALPTGSDHRPVITRFARADVSAVPQAD